MGRPISSWRQRVRALLGDQVKTDQLSDEVLDDTIAGSLRRFSFDRPRVTYSDYVGDGVTFDLTIPTAWLNEFSSVRGIEYPTGNRPETMLDLAEATLYPRDSAPTKIRLNDTTPASGKTARIYFTAPWPIPDQTTATDKISDTDFEPCCALAASLAAVELMGRAAGHQRSTLPQANLVGESNESSRWQTIAEKLLNVYLNHVGGAGSGAGGDGVATGPPAYGTIDWDAMSTWIATGHHFLFRGRR